VTAWCPAPAPDRADATESCNVALVAAVGDHHAHEPEFIPPYSCLPRMGPRLPLIILLLFFPLAAHAQLRVNNVAPACNWLAVGLGAVSPGFGGLAEYTHAENKWAIGLKAQGGGSFGIFGAQEGIEWYTLHGGYQFWSLKRSLRIVAGPAYYVHHMDTTYLFSSAQRHADDGIGVDVEVESILVHWKYFGMGAAATALVSRKYFFGGVILNLYVGLLE